MKVLTIFRRFPSSPRYKRYNLQKLHLHWERSVRPFEPFQRKKAGTEDRDTCGKRRKAVATGGKKKEKARNFRAHSHCIFNGTAHVHVCIWRWQMQKKGYRQVLWCTTWKKGGEFAPRARHCECKSEIKRGRMRADNLFEKTQTVSHALSATLCVRQAYFIAARSFGCGLLTSGINSNCVSRRAWHRREKLVYL
jgi:hypothetical protein